MNILITVDEKFIFPVKAMLYSLSQHNKNISVYIIYHFFPEGVLDDLKQYVEKVCNSELHPILVENIFQDAPLSSQYSKPELYFRLMAPYVLPKELDRVLYMDADIIVQSELSSFYEQNFDGAYAALIKDRYDFCEDIVKQKNLLGLGELDTYFNSGVILFNLKEFRKNISLTQIFDFINANQDKLRFFDQDTLNVILRDHKKICDEKFNFQVYPFEEFKPDDLKDKAVIHFTDLPKPWDKNYTGHLSEIFWNNVSEAN